jgi:hypothetical protein
MEERVQEMHILPEEMKSAGCLASELFGSRLGRNLIEHLCPPDLPSLRRLAPALRVSAILRVFGFFRWSRASPSWFYGKFCRFTGIVRWKLPNLIVLDNNVERSGKLLEDSLAYLGFAKCMRLNREPPEGLLKRIQERARIRIHRGLFRYVAVAGAIQEKHFILRRFPKPSSRGGNLILEFDSSRQIAHAEFKCGAVNIRRELHAVNRNVGADVGALFFEAVELTARQFQI